MYDTELGVYYDDEEEDGDHSFSFPEDAIDLDLSTSPGDGTDPAEPTSDQLPDPVVPVITRRMAEQQVLDEISPSDPVNEDDVANPSAETEDLGNPYCPSTI